MGVRAIGEQMRAKTVVRALLASSILILAAPANLAATGRVETYAGTGVKGFAGDDGAAKAAQLNDVFGITRGPDGALYVCDTDNQRIRRIDRNGRITTVA